MTFLAVHHSGNSNLAISFDCDTWEQAEEQASKHDLELQGVEEDPSG